MIASTIYFIKDSNYSPITLQIILLKINNPIQQVQRVGKRII